MKLKGMTWNHDRGLKPLLAASEKFQETHPDVEITWDARSLSDFELFPLKELADKYDFIMIDHPHIGTAYAQNLLLPLDEIIPVEFIKNQEENTVGLSHKSYYWKGHQWALAADAAAQFSASRLDILAEIEKDLPVTWDEVIALANSLSDNYKIAMPFVPIHAYSSFFSMCSQLSDNLFWSIGNSLDEEVGVSALMQLRKVLDVCDKDSYNMDPIQMLDKMAQEDEIIYSPLTYGYSTYSSKGYAKNRIKFSNMPSNMGKPSGSMIGGVGLAISSKCSNKETAAEFVMMVLDGTFQCNQFVDHYGQPGYRGAWLDERVNELSLDFYKDTLETMDEGSMRPRFNGYIEFQATAGSKIREFFIEERDDYKVFIKELNDLFFAMYEQANEK